MVRVQLFMISTILGVFCFPPFYFSLPFLLSFLFLFLFFSFSLSPSLSPSSFDKWAMISFGAVPSKSTCDSEAVLISEERSLKSKGPGV